jgi:hypothetical protein
MKAEEEHQWLSSWRGVWRNVVMPLAYRIEEAVSVAKASAICLNEESAENVSRMWLKSYRRKWLAGKRRIGENRWLWRRNRRLINGSAAVTS